MNAPADHGSGIRFVIRLTGGIIPLYEQGIQRTLSYGMHFRPRTTDYNNCF